jgi:hypothetical protein
MKQGKTRRCKARYHGMAKQNEQAFFFATALSISSFFKSASPCTPRNFGRDIRFYKVFRSLHAGCFHGIPSPNSGLDIDLNTNIC